ncbi:NCS2 family permease [Ignatzschineria cameli]|uniref:Guanine permease n=1 Tax=Ignatzschineria cameli TaxID=2182793 RepID=A0A2U2ATI2_9GAMM|nr:NCS2 family permease [Ignatzschineria cameli]PWD88039.1 guanine permease [Ignatzschineria cameli]
MLEKLFKLKEHGTTTRTEIIAGITTFLTMSYIIFVNPSLLSTTGMDHDSVFMATCLAAAIGTLVMAFVANYPVGLAPGMGLNAFFAFTIAAPVAAGGFGYTWQEALGAVFVSGVIFFALTITGLRSWIINGIPKSLRAAVGAGIGLFLAFIGLSNPEVGIIKANSATLVSLGDLSSHGALYAILGFFLIVVLDNFKIRGAILLSILIVSIISALAGHTEFKGVISTPPSIEPTFFQLSFEKVLSGSFVQILIALVLVELFDATGVLMSVAKQSGLLDETKVPDAKKRFNRALFSDSTAILSGSLLGTSSVTAYVESTAGVQAGGRTGLTALAIAACFILAIFFSSLANSIPAYATAPALVYIAGLMLRELTEVEWDSPTDSIPAALLVLGIPFTYSIAEGFAFGFISYVALKLGTGKLKDIHPATYIIAILFLVKFALF